MFLRFGVGPLLVMGLGAMEATPIEALLKTSVGEIRFELYPENAPKTVANFLKYVDGGHFEGGSFYRVVRMDNQIQNKVKIEVIQGGLSGKTDIVSYEPTQLERTSVTGLINGQPSLDFGGKRNPDGQRFAAFGRVIEGMDIVRKIQRMKKTVRKFAMPKLLTGS